MPRMAADNWHLHLFATRRFTSMLLAAKGTENIRLGTARIIVTKEGDVLVVLFVASRYGNTVMIFG